MHSLLQLAASSPESAAAPVVLRAADLRPLQVVIRFLVRASPKSRGGQAGLVTVILTIQVLVAPALINKITKESQLTVFTHEVALSTKGTGFKGSKVDAYKSQHGIA